MRKTAFFAALFGASTTASLVLADGVVDVDAGQKLFRQCAACHQVGPDAVSRVGPVLTNVVNAPVASVDDFRYSPALKDAGASGAVWDEASLDAFLTNPREYLPGNRMSFRGLRDADDRANLIGYLQSLGAGDDVVVEAGFTVAPEVLAITGDVEYGAYLASECTTCHQASGGDDGIPNIVGLPTDAFATAMHAYREKVRENPVMQLVAGRLGDEEIAALAAYFKDLED